MDDADHGLTYRIGGRRGGHQMRHAVHVNGRPSECRRMTALFLDCGTTVAHFAEALPPDMPLSVV